MNNQQPVMLIIPVIALILVVFLFIYLLKKTDNKAAFKRFAYTTLVLAFLLNFAWELIQIPLYKDAAFDVQHIVFCAWASVADAIMVLLIYFCFAFIYKNPFWAKQMSWQRILLLILVGFAGAVLAELRHTSAGNWSYSNYMPLLPVIGVGVVPLFQFMVLPVVIYFLSFKIIRHE